MVRVIYVHPDGDRQEVDTPKGESVMSTAIAEAVPGIIGDCRGGLTCATCHVFVDEAWIDKTGEREPDEEDMLEMTAVEATECSRLGCQIVLNDDLDGIVVHVPEAQE